MLTNKFYIIVFFSIIFLVSCATNTQSKIPVALDDKEIIVSQSDERAYQAIELSNGLKVLLISDSNATKAAASLDVNVGSSHNPSSYQGLAHFLEHMLFLGTKNYPVSDEYQQFIAAHGGRHNAYTAYENTNYFFDIDSEFLAEALDRFSDFFIHPLLSEKYIDRERNAVNAEYYARITSEYRRSRAVLSELMNKEHPASLFSVGNSETLAGEPEKLKAALMRFYNKWYYAENMRLVVLGKESLPELKSLVASRFSGIKSEPIKSNDASYQPVDMYPPGALPLYVEINALADINNLTIRFLLPSDREYKKKDPLGYISFVLGHEGKGSLYHYLRSKGLAESLSAGKSFIDDNNAVFSISIQLTNKGVKEKDAVVAYVFQAIRHLQSEKKLNRRIFEEIKTIQQIEFDYQQKQQPIHYVSSLSRDFHKQTVKNVLREGFMLEEFSPKLIQDFLQQMTLSNSVISFHSDVVKGDRVSRFFDAEYKIRALPDTLVQRWQDYNLNSSIRWPEKNPYLPERFSLVKEKKRPESTIILPVKVDTKNSLSLWKGAEADYGLPKGELTLFLRGLNISKNARTSVLMSLYAAAVQEQLNPQAYLGAMAGLSSSVKGHADMISLSVNGFSDKQIAYAKEALSTLAKPEIDHSRFALLKAQYHRELNNFKLRPPHRQAFTLLTNVLDPYGVTYKEKQKQLQAVTLDDLSEFIEQFSQSLQGSILMVGNYTSEQAEQVQQLMQDQYGEKLLDAPLPERVVIRAPEQGVVFSEPFVQKDALLGLFFQGSHWGDVEAARFALLGTILKGDFFDQLRTEQQMGYIVYATEANIKGLPGLYLLVQSPSNSVESIEESVRDFLYAQVKRLKSMPEEQWRQFQRSAISRYSQRAKNINELSGFWAKEITSGRQHFGRRFDVADQIKSIDQKQLVAFFQELIKENHSVTVRSEKEDTLPSKNKLIHQDVLWQWQAQQKRVHIRGM